MIVTRSELGRIQNDEIVRVPRVAGLAQIVEDVGLLPLAHIRGKTVEFGIGLSTGKRFGRRIDAHHFFGAASGQRKRKAAGVAEAIKRSKSATGFLLEGAGDVLRGQSAFALIDVKARLVPHAHIHTILHAVFYNFDDGRRLFSGKHAHVLF